ncbi:MAG: ATP-dependent DNA helicase RecG [Clostridia bacterium]|nr:ATP-dependent DNA helicase RecG [Clostridia bacterium]
MNELDRKIENLSGIGPKRAALFRKMGVDNVGALLEFYPRMYEDWSKCYTVSSAPLDTQCCVKATVVTSVKEHRIRKGMTLYKCTATDGATNMLITIFNNKYAAAKLRAGEEFLFFGKVGGNFNRKEMSSPQIEPVQSAVIRPIYRQTEGLNSNAIEAAVKQAVSLVGDKLTDPLCDDIRREYQLCHRRFAVERIHFPKTSEDVDVAKKRLVFEELLVLQLGMLRLKGRNRELTGANIVTDYSDEFLSKLPFEPTSAQRRAIKEAVADMQGKTPMNRLLQGDVGSGKTAVAAAIMYTCVKNGFQAAMMAPTEILAEQHCASLMKMMQGTKVRVMLLKGSTPAAEKRKINELLKSGEIDIIIGTHALIQNDVEFKNLGLVITDEQHRFGVAQRSALSLKGQNPHIYVMSATPIPRTLGLIMYGDLDISILDELPKGRQKIETYSVNSSYRQRAYAYVKKHLDEGRQGYIVCPMVEEGELDLVAAVKYYETLSKGEFKNYTVGLLHGKMKSAEKDQVMRAFKNGDIQLLVSTTVVEVGVDVPNAVIMVIENADRFGLSQLHQLRGRVGRGEHKSTCILISDAENEDAVRRLKVMCKTDNGFAIADEDLKLRGPGDFFGSRQHGLPELKIANIFTDMAVLKSAQRLAREIIKKDEMLTLPEHLGLRESVDKLFERAEQNSFN